MHAPGWFQLSPQIGALLVPSSQATGGFVFTTYGLYLKLHLKVFHSTEYLSLLNSPSHIFFIKQAPKTTNLPVALKVSVYKPLETVCNSLITFSKEVTDYRYTNKCHIRCLGPSNKILTQGKRVWGQQTWVLSQAKSHGRGETWPLVQRFENLVLLLSLTFCGHTYVLCRGKQVQGISHAQTQYFSWLLVRYFANHMFLNNH